MDSAIFKPLGSSITVSSAVNSNFNGNKLVRITHAGAVTTNHIITCKLASDSSTKWSIALTGGQDIILEKDTTDTITSNDAGTSLTGVAVAYRN